VTLKRKGGVLPNILFRREKRGLFMNRREDKKLPRGEEGGRSFYYVLEPIDLGERGRANSHSSPKEKERRWAEPFQQRTDQKKGRKGPLYYPFHSQSSASGRETIVQDKKGMQGRETERGEGERRRASFLKVEALRASGLARACGKKKGKGWGNELKKKKEKKRVSTCFQRKTGPLLSAGRTEERTQKKGKNK